MRTASLISIVLLASAPTAFAKRVPAPPPASVFDQSGISDWTKPPAPTTEPKFKPPVAKRLKLKNGMSLLVVENHKLPIVSMSIVIPGAGSSNDPKGKGGLASFTADLLDEGAGGLSAIGIAEETDRLGAGIGIYADVDASYVSVTTLAKTLDQTLDLASKIIMQPAFDDKEVERVKGDRMTALELRRDRPREVASIMLNAAIFGMSSAYGHPTSGIREEFKNLGAADVRTFYKERWNPAAMTLVVVGDVDPVAFKAKLDAGLGAWKPAGAKKPGKVVATPAKIGSRLLLVDRKDAAQSDVRIGIIGPDRKDTRFFAFEVFRTTLGDGFTSRLVQRLREQLGITYGAGASMDWRLARGPFVIATAIVTPSTGQGISETLKMVEDLATTDVPAEELEKSKQNLIRALPARFDTNTGTADAFAELALFGLPDDWYTRYADSVRRITAKDVKSIAKAVAPAKKLVISIVGDMSKVRADLDKLELGQPAMYDLYGMPLAATKN
ncbi:MAG: peptidase domain protein [Myxococcales bacterium]|nr:peptidase domain protein [Myxococcales bacterium]